MCLFFKMKRETSSLLALPKKAANLFCLVDDNQPNLFCLVDDNQRDAVLHRGRTHEQAL